ncbi:MAG: AraC family transcriptional regulator [Christensenellales bacterium]|nr:AraC family transcriptional regulator [Christensenellales bacterium]
MKSYPRLSPYKTENDPLSAFLSEFRFDVEYFTNWPQQDHKTLRNIVGSQMKLVLLESGHSTLFADKKNYAMSAGSCLFIPPYTVYDVETFEGVNSYEIFFSIYPIVREQEFLQYAHFTSITSFPSFISPDEFTFIRTCYTSLREQKPGAYAQISAMLKLLLIRILRQQNEQDFSTPIASNGEHVLMSRFFDYLETHLSEPVHVEQLCAALGVSQSYLYRCCRNVMGCSPSQAITRCKLRHAQSLLKNPELSIGQVAEAIGFDPYYFSSQFKKMFLLSPTRYRQTIGITETANQAPASWQT